MPTEPQPGATPDPDKPPTAGSEPAGDPPGSTGTAGPSAPPAPADTPSVPTASAPRPWGPRRTPAAIAAGLVTLGAGALLFEAVWQRTDHAATAWFGGLTGGLAARPVDDVWVLTGAAIAAALGLLLLVVALTPGLRHRLPLRGPAGEHGRVRAVLDRAGAALLLRDAAMRVPGVGAARVRVRRRRVKVRAEARFGDLAEVRRDVTDVVRHEAYDRVALAREPRVKVRVRRMT